MVNAEETVESTAGADAPMDVIVVTGTKLDLDRQETPMSVGVFDEDRLKSDYILNVEDVFDRTANAFTGATLFGSYSIRGVKNTNVTDGFSRANALSSLLVNETALGVSATDYVKPSLFDARVVEILRGPQSVAQGPNALIGSVVINYNDPSFDGYEGRTLGEVGNLGIYRLAAVQNVELVDDVLAARVAFETRQSDGDVTNVTTGQDDVQRTDEETFRGQLKLRPLATDELAFEVTYLRNRSDSNSFAIVETNAAAGQSLFDRIQTVNVPEHYPSEFDFVSAEGEWRLTDRLSVTSVTGYGDFVSRQQFDGDATATPALIIDFDVEEQVFSQEVRLNYRSDRIDALVGVFYSDADVLNGFDFQGLLPDDMGGFTPFNQFQVNEEGVEQIAGFAKANVRLTDRLSTTLGLRLNRENRTQSLRTDQTGASVEFEAEESFFQVLPTASLSYALTDQTSLGALYSRGYQGGGFAVALILNEIRPYDEEFIDNYEVFLRHASADSRFVFNASAYYFDWKDQQVPFTPEGGFPGFDEFVANAGSSSVYGLEIEAEAHLANGFTAFGSLGVSKTEFDEFIIDGEDLSGQEFPGAPSFNVALGFTYQAVNGVFASGTYSYVDSTYTELNSPDFTEVSERHLLGGRLGYRHDHWSVYAFGENLLDQDYELAVFDRRSIGIPGPLGRVGDPLAFGVGVDVNW